MTQPQTVDCALHASVRHASGFGGGPLPVSGSPVPSRPPRRRPRPRSVPGAVRILPESRCRAPRTRTASLRTRTRTIPERGVHPPPRFVISGSISLREHCLGVPRLQRLTLHSVRLRERPAGIWWNDRLSLARSHEPAPSKNAPSAPDCTAAHRRGAPRHVIPGPVADATTTPPKTARPAKPAPTSGSRSGTLRQA